jgi:hypothetical protein
MSSYRVADDSLARVSNSLSAKPFTEDFGRLVQMVTPHLAAALDAARGGARSHQLQAAPARDLRLVAHARRT